MRAAIRPSMPQPNVRRVTQATRPGRGLYYAGDSTDGGTIQGLPIPEEHRDAWVTDCWTGLPVPARTAVYVSLRGEPGLALASGSVSAARGIQTNGETWGRALLAHAISQDRAHLDPGQPGDQPHAHCGTIQASVRHTRLPWRTFAASAVRGAHAEYTEPECLGPYAPDWTDAGLVPAAWIAAREAEDTARHAESMRRICEMRARVGGSGAARAILALARETNQDPASPVRFATHGQRSALLRAGVTAGAQCGVCAAFPRQCRCATNTNGTLRRRRTLLDWHRRIQPDVRWNKAVAAPEHRTIGVELELGSAWETPELVQVLEQWPTEAVSDGSLRGAAPVEVRLGPLAGPAIEEGIRTVCGALIAGGAEVNPSCGGHIHVGAGDAIAAAAGRHWDRAARAIEAMSNGLVAMVPSRQRSTYCRTGYSVEDRYRAISLYATGVHGTIEYRIWPGDLDPARILARVRISAACTTAIARIIVGDAALGAAIQRGGLSAVPGIVRADLDLAREPAGARPMDEDDEDDEDDEGEDL